MYVTVYSADDSSCKAGSFHIISEWQCDFSLVNHAAASVGT